MQLGLPDEIEREFDTRYTMATNAFVNEHYTFDGYTVTKIWFNNETQFWRMDLISNPNIYATTDIKPFDYPLGIRTWNVTSPILNGEVELNLNSCDDFNSFSCNDGACITIEER